MKLHNKIFIIFAIILLSIITIKLYKDYQSNEELKMMIIKSETNSLSSLISAFRDTYQDTFLEHQIAIDDKTVNLLPVKTIKSMGDQFSKELGDRATIRTVSDRPRNIENQANTKELEVLKYFNDNKDQDSYFKILDNNTFYYAKPLYIQAQCLKCHGKKEDAPLTIRKRYDKSYNYKLGELRGITTITLSKKDIVQKLSDSYMITIKVAIVIYILFLLAIYLMIRIILKNQEQYTQTLEEKVIKRTNELQSEKEQIQTIVESNNNAIIAVNFKGEIITYNKKAQEIFGWTKQEMLGTKNLLNIIPPQYQQQHIEAIAAYFKTGILNGVLDNARQAEGLHKDGTIFPIRISIGSKFKSSDTIVIANISDISQEKQQDKLILQQSKMVAMGEMIGNIAHQWRQPLSVISTGATGLKLQHEHGMLTDEILINTSDSINDNAQYLSKTIDDFKNFIKGDRKKSIFNLSKTIQSFLNLVDGAIHSNNINMILDLDDNIKIDGYENELTQCIINVFNNSKDALNDLEQNPENKELEKFIFISTEIMQNDIVIKIKDNANGIPSDILPKIFEPYFTTKHQSQGTGIGLQMTYNLIVDGMGGNIEANNVEFDYKSKSYIGAEFRIVIPQEG